MTTIIVTVLALLAVQVLLPAGLRVILAPVGSADKMKYSLGPRDESLPSHTLASRAQRAQENLTETLPIFLTLALLHIHHQTGSGFALQGATLYLIARIVYVPAYLSGIPGVRSLAWMASLAGMVMMGFALIR